MKNMKVKYNIVLTPHEIERLNNIMMGLFSKRIKQRAEIILRINAGQTYRYIGTMLGVSQNTITNTLERFTSGGIDFVLIPRNNVF